ncbi:MAG TPA: hypothetical protein VF077_09585 [Nitrospiraceae bacterium]
MKPPCPIPGYRFAEFASWYGVLHAIEYKVGLYYHAPLDATPRRVIIKKTFKNGKVRICAGEVTFTADSSHIARFFWLEKSEEQGKKADLPSVE